MMGSLLFPDKIMKGQTGSPGAGLPPRRMHHWKWE